MWERVYKLLTLTFKEIKLLIWGKILIGLLVDSNNIQYLWKCLGVSIKMSNANPHQVT